MDDARTDHLTDHPFWRFSLAVYGAGAGACLALQDRRGVDVNMILFAVWAGRCGHRLSAAELEGLCRVVMPWTASVVRPLRAVRRWIKAQNSEQRHVDARALRDQVKACELQAEAIAQYHLFSYLPLASSSCVSPSYGKPGDAVDNLLDYLACAGIVRLEQIDYEDLSSVLCASFEQLSLSEAVALFEGRCFAPQR